MPVITGSFGLLAMALAAGGIVLLVHGDLSGLPFVLVPLAMTAFLAVLDVAGRRSLERNIPKLIQEMNRVLDSTATFTGHTPAA